MLNLSQKKELVERLATQLAEAQITILIDYKGLDVQAITRLRHELREAGATMEVVKNTLLNLASQNTDAALMADFFKGPSAIVMSSTDPVAPSKILIDFAKDNEKLEIKTAAFGADFWTRKQSRPWPKCHPGKNCWPSWSIPSMRCPHPLSMSWLQCPGGLSMC